MRRVLLSHLTAQARGASSAQQEHSHRDKVMGTHTETRSWGHTQRQGHGDIHRETRSWGHTERQGHGDTHRYRNMGTHTDIGT